MICKKLYEKDFYLVLIVVEKQDYGKRMIHRGAYNVTDVVQARWNLTKKKPSKGGIGELEMTIKEQNALDLKRKWKRFLKEQNEKEKAKKENKKAEEKDWLVSQAND